MTAPRRPRTARPTVGELFAALEAARQELPGFNIVVARLPGDRAIVEHDGTLYVDPDLPADAELAGVLVAAVRDLRDERDRGARPRLRLAVGSAGAATRQVESQQFWVG